MKDEALNLIRQAKLQTVSDIHINPAKDHYTIYFRINGQMILQETATFNWGKRFISYFKFLADMDIGERRKPQSGAITYPVDESHVELRFSTMMNIHQHESLVIRILYPSQETSKQFRTFFPANYLILQKLIKRKSGLILFSGPVGSGKTTTIYQLLRQRMDQETIQVITMEDPVEIYEERFLQTEVNERANITYNGLIKASLRHHPDILMIGEIRDEETARMCIRGALTGHLMIATIHAKNTLGVIGRLQELRITDQQLQQTLIAVVSQRLISQYCHTCGGPCKVTCSHIPNNQKRLALLEILTGKPLNTYLANGTLSKGFIPLNQTLRKAWALGYVDTDQYYQYEIV